MPDQRVTLSDSQITMDADLALQEEGLHLIVMTDAQRYIVRRLLGYAQRESHYYVELNNDGTYTTPSAAELDDILAVVDGLEDELMSNLAYEEGTQIVDLVPVASGGILLDSGYQTLAWTRVGRVVHVSGRLLVLGVSSPVGLLRLTPLPFLVADGGPGYAAISVLGNYLLAGAVTSLQAAAIAGTSYAQIYRFSDGVLNPVSEQVQAGSVFIIGGSYFTDDE